MAAPAEFLKFVDDNASKFIARLGAAVAIPRYEVHPRTFRVVVPVQADDPECSSFPVPPPSNNTV